MDWLQLTEKCLKVRIISRHPSFLFSNFHVKQKKTWSPNQKDIWVSLHSFGSWQGEPKTKSQLNCKQDTQVFLKNAKSRAMDMFTASRNRVAKQEYRYLPLNSKKKHNVKGESPRKKKEF